MFMLYFIYRPENPHHMEMFDQRVNASIQIEKEQQTKQKLLFSKFFVVFSCESFREGNEREKNRTEKICVFVQHLRLMSYTFPSFLRNSLTMHVEPCIQPYLYESDQRT